jgi:5-formyltetrahydrofolate cyclo-ligase
MNKKELRLWLRRRRALLSEAEWRERNTEVLKLLKQEVERIQPKLIHSFLPKKGEKEPDVRPLLEQMKDIIIAVPKTLPGTFQMQHFVYEGPSSVSLNPMGIPEPVEGTEPIDIKHIDLVLVPMLGFDLQGQRLGYGGGYYDRFLANECRADVIKIGLSLLPPLEEPLAAEPHDVPLDAVICPVGVYRY